MSQILSTVNILHHVGALKKFPEYEAAKNGDFEKATLLARKFISAEMANSIAVEVRNLHSVLLPVVGFESVSSNCIPSACAVRISELTGIPFAEGVIRKTPDSRTSQDGVERIFNTPVFEGLVKKGVRYYLLDDTITQGGTLAALARYIDQNEGIVTGAIALTGQQRSAILAITDATLETVLANFKDIENDFIKTTDRHFNQLTESEGRYLTQASLIQRFRDETTARAAAQEYGMGDRGLQIARGYDQANSNVIQPPIVGVTPYEQGKLTQSLSAQKPMKQLANPRKSSKLIPPKI